MKVAPSAFFILKEAFYRLAPISASGDIKISLGPTDQNLQFTSLHRCGTIRLHIPFNSLQALLMVPFTFFLCILYKLKACRPVFSPFSFFSSIILRHPLCFLIRFMATGGGPISLVHCDLCRSNTTLSALF